MRKGNLILCNKCKGLMDCISSRAIKDAPKGVLKIINRCYCDECEKTKNKLR